jgi:hypothetical protein
VPPTPSPRPKVGDGAVFCKAVPVSPQRTKTLAIQAAMQSTLSFTGNMTKARSKDKQLTTAVAFSQSEKSSVEGMGLALARLSGDIHLRHRKPMRKLGPCATAEVAN